VYVASPEKLPLGDATYTIGRRRITLGRLADWRNATRGPTMYAGLAPAPGGNMDGFDFVVRGRSSVMDPDRDRGEQIAELKELVKQCYCGLGPACEIWRKMTPDQRADCTRDKRAYAELLWKHGVVR
jgi:hypothetical protein